MILLSSLPAQACFHTPVLLSQVLAALRIEKGRKYIDATLGGGGYSFEILKRGGIVLGIDRDKEAIRYVREKLGDRSWTLEIKNNLFLEHGNFADLQPIALKFGFDEVAGIIFDLGMSSYQLEGSGRGFSWRRDEPLDMRMDIRQEATAADLINHSSKERLYEIFTKYAEELHSRTVAEAIVRARSLKGDIKRTNELSQLISETLDRIYSKDNQFNKFRILQSTKARIFQALRIAVNGELENLQIGLKQAIDLLGVTARIVVLSYHSLEDRIAKLTFKDAEQNGILRVVTFGILKADRFEKQDNPKAKSAKLRIAEKIM